MKTSSAQIDQNYTLEDRYTVDEGRVFLTGIQALVRLPMMQARLDRAAGHKTAGLISGYRGSPLGTYDLELARNKSLLDSHDIRFEPGLNEDLAATALWGVQQLETYPGPRVDGVFGIWYGKGPGVDRSADVLRHANMFGVSRLGGVLALAGDDHTAQSSVLAHQTDHIFKSVLIPHINPSSVAEYLELGLAGFALSRFSGCWVGFKCETQIVEGGQVVNLPGLLPRYKTPDDIEIPPHGFNYDPRAQWPHGRLEVERRLIDERMPAAMAFWRANKFDRIVFGDNDKRRLGIVSTGKAHAELLEALRLLGLDEAAARRMGIDIYKVTMQWPVEPERLKEFALGRQDLLVVEEKRTLLESQLKDLLYHLPADERPFIHGKYAASGEPLLRERQDLTPDLVASAVLKVFGEKTPDKGAEWRRILEGRRAIREASLDVSPVLPRKPFFCSGCPHNTSTKVPDGAMAGAGIGCHIMAMGQGKAENVCQMGGEGVFWVGVHTFSDMPHMFQNMGDGTYQHSGILAIRQAVAAKTPITYKILFNDAVAMTGGQAAEGQLTVEAIAAQLHGEGVKRIAIASDEPEKYDGVARFPAGATVHHRDDLMAVQKDMQAESGVSAIIYDQTCAAEKRRRRKRGTYPDPAKRIFINDRVCEGCGDCSAKSNCISVEPVETAFGTKRKINQSSCNKDYSCVKGFCPSFISLEPDGLAKPDNSHVAAQEDALFENLPEPDLPAIQDVYNILVAGIGGTGVITVGAVLSMAAHLEGKDATILDFTGLAQKNGAVMSYLRLAAEEGRIGAAKIIDGEADVLLACDMVAAAADEARRKLSPQRTASIINTVKTPTAHFVETPSYDFPAERAKRQILDASEAGRSEVVEATRLAEALFGDAIAANLFMVGFAWQKGLIPVSAEAIERALELNGVAVDFNKRAFRWGRVGAVRPAEVEVLTGGAPRVEAPKTVEELVDFYAAELAAYQNEAYAERYRALVAKLRETDMKVHGAPGLLSEAAARYYYKVLAYKDEYEVARLYADPAYWDKLKRQFKNPKAMKLYLAPPLLSRPDPETGEMQKKAFGPWVFKLFGVLQHFKVLRGTAFDIFGWTEERKGERDLIVQYEKDLERLRQETTAENYDRAVAIASLPDDIRGYGHVKHRNLMAAREKHKTLWDAFPARPTESKAA